MISKFRKAGLGAAVALCVVIVGPFCDAGEKIKSLNKPDFDFESLAFVKAARCVSWSEPYKACILELDVSGSTVSNHVQLYLVVSNRGTADLDFRVWRINYRVAKIRNFSVQAGHLVADVQIEKIVSTGESSVLTAGTLTMTCKRIEGKLSSELETELSSQN